jgi:predicted nucleic acid-binding protein
VLVAGALTVHPFHARAWPWIEAVEREELEGTVCVHALAELNSVLTRLPQGLSVASAATLVNRMVAVYRVVPLAPENYQEAAARCATRSLRSGSIFDALHVVAAESIGADVLLTFDEDDFTRLSRDGGPRVVVPPDPPSLQV